MLAALLGGCTSPDSPPDREESGCDPAPGYSATDTLFGTSLSSSDGSAPQALAQNDSLFGPLEVVRHFDSAVPPHAAWEEWREPLGGRAVVASFRDTPQEILSGDHDARILNHFRTAPVGGPVFWSYFHEPEPHIDAGTFTAEGYREAWRHLANLVATLCRTDLLPTLILTGWTADPASGRDWRDYYPGDDFISVVAWDAYNSATTTPTRYTPPEELFEPVLRLSREIGKPWGIAETGSVLVPGDEDGAGRAAWLTALGDHLAAEGAAFVTYFQSTRDGDFKLTDPASVTAWRQWVSDDGPPTTELVWTPSGPVGVGTASVAVDVARLSGGQLAGGGDEESGVVRFPSFVKSASPPRSALRVRPSGPVDTLAPGSADFTYGADIFLDTRSSGSRVDNGDNVLQRGLSSDAVLFKAELDDRRPGCTVRGDSGEIIVRAEESVAPEHWYRLACIRRGDTLTLEVTDLERGGDPATTTAEGPIGEVAFTDSDIPMSVGGKMAANGGMVRSATDQFNGAMARPVLRIGD